MPAYFTPCHPARRWLLTTLIDCWLFHCRFAGISLRYAYCIDTLRFRSDADWCCHAAAAIGSMPAIADAIAMMPPLLLRLRCHHAIAIDVAGADGFRYGYCCLPLATRYWCLSLMAGCCYFTPLIRHCLRLRHCRHYTLRWYYCSVAATLLPDMAADAPRHYVAVYIVALPPLFADIRHSPLFTQPLLTPYLSSPLPSDRYYCHCHGFSTAADTPLLPIFFITLSIKYCRWYATTLPVCCHLLADYYYYYCRYVCHYCQLLPFRCPEKPYSCYVDYAEYCCHHAIIAITPYTSVIEYTLPFFTLALLMPLILRHTAALHLSAPIRHWYIHYLAITPRHYYELLLRQLRFSDIVRYTAVFADCYATLKLPYATY